MISNEIEPSPANQTNFLEKENRETTRVDNEAKLQAPTENQVQSEESKISQINPNQPSIDNLNSLAVKNPQTSVTVGNFFSVHLRGSIESGHFNSINDVYLKYSIQAGSDWILTTGSDVGITQIARYRLDESNQRQFVWNQPMAASFRSYNFYGYPQVIVSVYNFDFFGNDQLVGYGCAHLPVCNQKPNHKKVIKIFSPQSSSYTRQLLSWITGRKPELVDSNLIARGDCRSVLHMVDVGEVNLSFNVTTKDISLNGYRSN